MQHPWGASATSNSVLVETWRLLHTWRDGGPPLTTARLARWWTYPQVEGYFCVLSVKNCGVNDYILVDSLDGRSRAANVDMFVGQPTTDLEATTDESSSSAVGWLICCAYRMSLRVGLPRGRGRVGRGGDRPVALPAVERDNLNVTSVSRRALEETSVHL